MSIKYFTESDGFISETYSSQKGIKYIFSKCIFTKNMILTKPYTYDQRCINSFKGKYYFVKKESTENKLYIINYNVFDSGFITKSSLFMIKILDKIDKNIYNVEIFSVCHKEPKFIHVGQVEIEKDNFLDDVHFS